MKLKITLIASVLLMGFGSQAQTGFSTTASNWSIPQGGALASYASHGYDVLADGLAGGLVGDQAWTTMDMNGDNKPDLVVTAEVKSIPGYNVDTVFGTTANPYWKVYINNGTGYNATPISWTLPQGGTLSSFVNYGFNAIADYTAGGLVGDQAWTTMDMNGDNKPDLVVTAEVRSIPGYNVDTVFGTTNPYWKVYLNTGTGFSTTATNWTIPQGGTLSSFVNYGYNAIADGEAGGLVGDQAWTTMDMNGDHKPDLVVTAEVRSIPGYNVDTVFGTTSPYWKVYLNTGSGFNTTATTWTIPQGGTLSSFVNYGYNAVADYTAGGLVGDQAWSTLDMNGDSKPDLVVTAEVRSIPGYNVDTVFGTTSPYWKVYLNTGTGFNTTATNWTIPQGGTLSSFVNYGYNAIADGDAGGLVGDQAWSTVDMNGDSKPDLVVTAEVKSIPNYNVDTVFGTTANPYWKVYLSTGSGFNTTAINWTLPQGGAISSIANYGFNAVADYIAGGNEGDQMWSIIDMDGNHKMDLAVTAQVTSNTNYIFDQVFGMPSTPYWKVYLNNGPLGVPLYEEGPKVIVYPNPSQGLFTIQAEAENITVNITDMTGRSVSQQSGKTVNLTGYSKGMYLMDITMEGQTVTKKIILE